MRRFLFVTVLSHHFCCCPLAPQWHGLFAAYLLHSSIFSCQRALPVQQAELCLFLLHLVARKQLHHDQHHFFA